MGWWPFGRRRKAEPPAGRKDEVVKIMPGPGASPMGGPVGAALTVTAHPVHLNPSPEARRARHVQRIRRIKLALADLERRRKFMQRDEALERRIRGLRDELRARQRALGLDPDEG